MRKIEKQMIEAIRSGKNWESANTRVKHFADDGEFYANIFLHGNHIATVRTRHWPWPNDKHFDDVQPNEHTFSRWPTATTRSRLRALGVDASIKNFHACIDGRTLYPKRSKAFSD